MGARISTNPDRSVIPIYEMPNGAVGVLVNYESGWEAHDAYVYQRSGDALIPLGVQLADFSFLSYFSVKKSNNKAMIRILPPGTLIELTD